MGRTGRISPALSSLPKVVFEKIEEDVSTQPAGVHDLQARSYGYNDFSDFARPEHYIRHIEPLESDLARQVEYDMDEQDQEWLDAINADRRKEQVDKISYELFEIIMDRLEKEWFDLTKKLPKPDLALPSEDSTCAVCDDSEGENSNAIVFCDGCNLAVHQDCYGVPYIPEGQWLCRKCTVSPENPVQCILCPNEGGAFKQTTHGDWVHLLCAIWVPETRVVNEVFMEPVAGVEKISKQRWKLRCSICDIREGACIQCAKTSCFLAFHATCARKEKLLLSMKSTQGSEPATLTSYCERHLPKEQQEARASALAAEESQTDNDIGAKSNKTARAYAKTYQPGPPLVPALIVNRIMQYVAKVTVRKKAEFILMLCRYWSLKREARRGAPLLKRLHLEPWTAVAGVKARTDQEKLMKLEQLRRLREDLLSLRALTELCRKRESRKYRQAEIVYETVAKIFFPHRDAMRRIFDRIVSLDKQEFFKNPVSKHLVPDYYDIVTRPMCWSVIESRLDRHEYWDVQTFKDDVELVIDNALLYNKPDSAIYKSASRLKKNVRPLYEELDKERVPPLEPSPHDFNTKAEPVEPVTVQESMDIDDPSLPSKTSQLNMTIGDLEPPLDVLGLLESPASIQGDLNIDLQNDPLVSLFNYELGKPRILSEPAPPPPPKPRKLKRDRKAEYERAKAKKAAAAAAAMATAAEALTLLNGNHHTTVAASQNNAQPPPLGEERHGTAQGLQIFPDNLPGFCTSKPECIAIDTFMGPAQEATRESENIAETTPTSPRAERPLRRKRPSITLPGQSEIPPMVSDVDNRDSFKMFDAGWILPPEQRRRGRPPLDRAVLPPPRKKLRTEQGPSRLSVASTLASENQTVQASPQQEFSAGPPLSSASSKPTSIRQSAQPVHEGSTPKPSAENVAHTDIMQTSVTDKPAYSALSPVSQTEPASKPPLPLLDQSILQTKIVESANGTIIIEELDTPAIRRAKNLKRKEEKRQEMLRRNSIVNNAAATGESSGVPGKNLDSELSSLSEFGSELTEESGKPRHKRKRGQKSSTSVVVAKKGEKENPVNVTLGEGEKVEGGTLVWAKADSYPWWPAVIFEDDDPDVPHNILQGCQEAREKRKTKLHILRFFDKNQSWQYLAVDRLMLLGEDPELDEEMRSATSKRQRWKSAGVRRDCCDAYKLAMSEMETGSDGGRGGAPMKTTEDIQIDNL